jgi:hypothetical protein
VIYRLADFIYNLEQQGMGELNIQSDEALELINESLPRNMMVARLFLEETTGESITDIEPKSG